MISNEERHDNKTIVTISDIGSNHRMNCMPNQDSVGYKCVGDDFVMVISDGVGSCKEAETGSKCVVDATIRLFLEMEESSRFSVNHEMAEALISFWKDSIGDKPLDEYCATVKAVIKIGSVAKVISLGDGFIAITSNGMSVTSPVEEENFINETKCMSPFVSSKDIWIGDFYFDKDASYTVFCCTDGVANNLQKGKELELVEEIDKNISSSILMKELENLIKEIGDYSFDDKTVGVVKYEQSN